MILSVKVRTYFARKSNVTVCLDEIFPIICKTKKESALKNLAKIVKITDLTTKIHKKIIAKFDETDCCKGSVITNFILGFLNSFLS